MTQVDAPFLGAMFTDGATVETGSGVFRTTVEELVEPARDGTSPPGMCGGPTGPTGLSVGWDILANVTTA